MKVWNMVRGGAVVALSLGLASVGTGMRLSANDVSASIIPPLEPMGIGPVVNSNLSEQRQAFSSLNQLQAPTLTAKFATANPQEIIPPQTNCELTSAYFHNSSHNPGDIGIQWTVDCGGVVQSSISMKTYLYLHYCNYLFCDLEQLDARATTSDNVSKDQLGAYGACVTGSTDSYYSTASATIVGDGVTVVLNGTSGPTDVKCQPK